MVAPQAGEDHLGGVEGRDQPEAEGGRCLLALPIERFALGTPTARLERCLLV